MGEWQGGIVKTPENLAPNTKLRVELWGSSAGLPDKMLGVMVLRGSAITELKGKPADEHLVKKETGHIRIGMLEISRPGKGSESDLDAALMAGGMGGKVASDVKVFADLEAGTIRLQVEIPGVPETSEEAEAGA